MKISILIPCYNEDQGIDHLKKQLKPLLSKLLDLNYDYELLLLDDGSTDGTWQKLNEAFQKDTRVKLIQHGKNKNLGGCLRTGIKAASGEVLIPIDSDCTYRPADIIPMLALYEQKKADVVVASPYHPQGRVIGVPIYRLIPSYSASWIYQHLTSTTLHTFTGLFRIYRLAKLRRIRVESQGFVSSTEILLKLIKSKATIVEYPTTLGVRQYNQSKIRIVITILDHLKLMKNYLTGQLS